MLIKLLGGLIIVGACCFVGFEMSKELSGRVHILKEFITVLEKMHSLISYGKMPLSQLYAEISEDETIVGRFFKNIEWTGEPSGEWKKELKKLPYITKSDIRVLQMLADNLGKTDSENQLRDIKLAINDLNSALSQAKEIETRDSKMYKSMSFFAGIAVAILLI